MRMILLTDQSFQVQAQIVLSAGNNVSVAYYGPMSPAIIDYLEGCLDRVAAIARANGTATPPIQNLIVRNNSEHGGPEYVPADVGADPMVG